LQKINKSCSLCFICHRSCV